MRTRNRGQKRSIVSSLGLGPKQSRHRSADHKYSESKRSRVGALCLRSHPRLRWSSEVTRTRISSNLGRPRIRKRGGRGIRGSSRLHCAMRVDSETCIMSSASLMHTAYATRTKSKELDSFSSISDSSTLRSRIKNVKKEDKSTFDLSKPNIEVEPKPYATNILRRGFSRGTKRGRPRFFRGLSRPIRDSKSRTNGKSVDCMDSEIPPQGCLSKISDSPEHNVPVVDCVDLKDAVKPSKSNEDSYRPPEDNKLDKFEVKSEDIFEASDNLPVPTKRRRGRPLKHCSVLVPKVNTLIKLSESKENTHSEPHESFSLHQDSCRLFSEPTREREFAGPNLVRTSCTGPPILLHFGATDDVLQEVLGEVNVYGFVKLPVKRIRKGRQKPLTAPCKVDESQFVMSFNSPSVEKIFNSICDDGKLNDELASKDLFLAMNGLLRPGVCEVWRRRREDRSKQLSRNLMGRLRPNPRPRRYSDMISQSNHSHIDGLISLDSIHSNEKIRHQSSRPNTVSAARLTAAKKLIRAKSHVQSSLQITPIRSQSTGYVDELCNQKSTCLDSRTGRSTHRPPKMSVSMSSRTSRRPDVSHHIDWKFCYASSNKQNEVAALSNSLQRRRRQANFTGKSRIENAGGFSPMRTLNNSLYNLEQDDLEDSCDIRIVDTGSHMQLKSENGTHLQISSSNDIDSFGMNRKLMELTDDRRLERRRKKRRAITFQRKRPNERFLASHREEKWHSSKTYLRDDSSASSSTSKSGIVDAYGRSFRQARWYHHRPPKDALPDRISSSYRCHSSLESHPPRKSERSVSSRSMHTGSKLSSRRTILPELTHTHGSHHRIPRRPDRMCQLTLLDRLVLGLNCSVSQNDDEIHIKQLHAEELNILTQRMSRTGFFIQSLALRQNANNDAEYNIVLTFSSENEVGARRTRCPNSLFRSKFDSHDRASSYRSLCDQNAWRKIKNHSRSRRISCLASRHSYSARSHYTKIFQHYKDPSSSSLLGGYHSDSGLLTHRPSSFLREVHSDDEELETHRPNHFERLNIIRKIGHISHTTNGKLGDTYSVLEPVNKVSLRHLQVNSSSSLNKMETHRSCLPLEHCYAAGNTDMHKRSGVLSRVSSVKEDEHTTITAEELPTIHINNSSNLTTNNSNHGVSKREANIYVVGAVQNIPFRRHSPRKVIRKVYTGSLTIPKILNRKRISGVPTNSLGGQSVGMSITSTSSLTNTLVTNSIVSAVSCSTSSSSDCPISSTPTAVFHETQSVPIYSPATQFRRLQGTGASLSIVQTPIASLEQPKINVPPLTVIPSVTTDPQTVAKVNVQNSNNATSLRLNQPEAGLSVDTTDHENMHADHLSKSMTIEHVTSDDYCLHNVSNGNLTNGTESITETPQIETEVKSFSTNVGSSETDLKVSTNPIVPSATDVCHLSSISYNVVNATSLHTSAPVNSTIEDEDIFNMDDSQTPATSLSASQLLKLKRFHDEVGRPTQRRDSKSPHCTSHMPSQVHSPIYLPARSQNQSQPLESETDFTQCSQPSQLQQSQQSIQYSSSVLPSTTGYNTDFRSFPIHLNQDLSHKSNPKLEIDEDDDDDMEDFELKNVTKVYEPSVTTSFQPTSISTHKLTSNRIFDNNTSALSTVPTTVSSESQSIPFLGTHYPTIMRTPRISWPFGRSTFTSTFTGSLRLPSQCFNPLASTPVRCFPDTDQNTGNRSVGQCPSTSRVSTVESVSDHFLLSGKPFISSSISPVLSGSVGIPVMTTVQSSANASICPGPPKRTVVHKYHSFRKILPKSDRPIMLPTAPGLSLSPFSSNTAGLGKFSVPSSSFGIYRPASLGVNTVLPCEVTADGAYIMDLSTSNLTDDGSSIPIRRSLCTTSLALASSNSSVLATNPASQLLKSLLERDDSRSTNVVTTFATTNNLSFSVSSVVSTSTSTSGSGTSLWNQPAHQSRGTWQLGKRAVSCSNHRSPSDILSVKISQSVFPTSTSSSPTSSNPPPILPPTLRLTPGPTSRLQQLQQHYQRQQEAQRRFEQDSLSKLGVADIRLALPHVYCGTEEGYEDYCLLYLQN
ncbi:hypothetical protein EWB00_007872 [Schistosoma japonicum]|uniref:Uncharacterized protein n=1 Tax=Schistosoma japonicum TaxID=6182 RepID=A0A4Z2CSI1_SCHJA|nr:hypothetical protein EWB00_007872 [Schistosoma japonicum]